MTPSSRFWVICIVYWTLQIVILLKCDNVGSHEINCEKEKHEEYAEDFLMKMGLCRRNISISCSSKPSHPCLKNQTVFKATALLNGQMGQCLIEGNVSSERTLRFYVEARRIKNPNEAGSRSLGSEPEEHHRGKCILKYVCDNKYVRSVSMDCGSVIMKDNASLHNFTKRRAYWVAPKNHKSLVHFSSTLTVSLGRVGMVISDSKIYAPTADQQQIEMEESVTKKSASSQRGKVTTKKSKNKKGKK